MGLTPFKRHDQMWWDELRAWGLHLAGIIGRLLANNAKGRGSAWAVGRPESWPCNFWTAGGDGFNADAVSWPSSLPAATALR